MGKDKLPKEQPAVEGGLFMPSKSARPFFSTGCYMVDLLLGGGYCEGQIIKLRGDSKTGKSLFAVEGAANFLHRYPTGRVRYLDRENAFDEAYVRALGIDVGRFDRPDGLRTVEDVTADIVENLMSFSKNAPKAKKKASKKKVAEKPLLYVVDSWDGLSDEAELDRDTRNNKTFAMTKQKKGQELGRRIQSLCEGVPFTLMVVTQNRWKQSKMPGLPAVRSNSGGSWLDFFPTQSIDLATEKRIENTRSGHKRKYGQWIKVISDKNRRSGPQHPVMVPIMFGYGVCDLSACVRFLIDEDGWSLVFDSKEKAVSYLGAIWKLDADRYDAELKRIRKHAGELFEEIGLLFAPKRKKYGA